MNSEQMDSEYFSFEYFFNTLSIEDAFWDFSKYTTTRLVLSSSVNRGIVLTMRKWDEYRPT